MTNKNTSDNFEKGKPYFKHKNAILSAPVRHMFMIATIWYLSHINKNISIMEIGSWFGASALSWAQGLKEYADGKGNLTCIDAWKPFFNLEEHQDNEYVIEMEKLLESDFAYKVFLHNISTVPNSIVTQHFRGKSENILKFLKDESYSVIFIDADHTYDFVKKDILESLRLVENHGIICGDDLNMQMLENAGLHSQMKPLMGKPKVGTYVYRNKDYFYDQIVINKQLKDQQGLSIVSNSLYILDLPKYRQQEGNYSHYPFRFWAGNRLLGGYSDHLAIKIKIKKN